MLQHLQDDADGCTWVHGRLYDARKRLLYDPLILALQTGACRDTPEHVSLACYGQSHSYYRP